MISFDDKWDVVSHAGDPDWLEKRKLYVTGSEVAALFGESPWKTREEILVSKTMPPGPQRPPTRAMWWGTEREQANATGFSRIFGCEVLWTPYLVARGQVAATLDFTCEPPDPSHTPLDFTCSSKKHVLQTYTALLAQEGRGVLEMKNTGEFYGRDWKRQVPRHYWMQVQTQLYVTGLPYGVICAMIGADDFRAYVIQPDPDWVEEMLEEVRKFWLDVQQLEADMREL